MRITMNDGTVLDAPDPKPFDIVAFERQFHVSASSLANDAHVEHALFLAWHALKRTGKTALPFEGFLTQVDDFEGEEVPLEVAPPTPSE